MAARLSIMRAARQLAVEADIHLHVRNFRVVNQVGAASIDARLDCDAFASTHSATSHFDRASFVGLAWRPPKESICCGACARVHTPRTSPLPPILKTVCALRVARAEIYATGDERNVFFYAHTRLHAHTRAPTHADRLHSRATGRANLPGSTRERDMLSSFARMLPELFRHSDRADVLERIPKHLRDAHRPRAVERDDAPLVAPAAVHGDGLVGLGGARLRGLWGSTCDDEAAAEALALFGSMDQDAFVGDDDGLTLLEDAGF